MFGKRKLKVGLLNAGSLGTRHDEFLVAMERHSVDIMAINETWLREGEEGRAPAVPGYRLRHVPRPQGVRARGGGVGFYIRRGLTLRVLPHPPHPSVEQMWLGINVNGQKICIGTAYRPPWLNVDLFIDALSSSLESLAWCNSTILLGDFNINLLNDGDSNCNKLKDFLLCYRMTQHVSVPTHLTSHSATLIDLVCTDMKINTIAVHNIQELSNHAFIVCQLNTAKIKIRPLKITRRSIKEINHNLFQTDLELIDWDHISSSTDVNDMVESLNNALSSLFDLHAPLKSYFAKYPQYPWITYNIKLMMKRRDEAYNRARSSGEMRHKLYYKELKNVVNVALDNEKKAYFNQYVNYNNDPRTLWKTIKKNVRIKNNSEIPSNIFNNPTHINEHFLNVPGKSSICPSQLIYFKNNCNTSATFTLSVVSEFEVAKIIKSLKSNAMGVDGISLDMLILSLPNSLPAITAIVNRSIETNTYPTIWQHGLVRPIPKTRCPSNINDLRPITILPCASKVLERVVADQLRAFLENNQILPPKQSGFRKAHSTTTALLHMVDDVLSAQDAGQGTLLVLLDFSRAFDCINVPLLLAKLHFHGFTIDAINWFDSYFKNRVQQVELCDSDGNRVRSDPRKVTRGVPQGSILGPLLFIIYCADIVQNIHHCNYHIFADDTQIYTTCQPNDIKSAVNRINKDLENIAAWSESNSLVLNGSKTKFMILGSKDIINKIERNGNNMNISLKGETLERVREARNLGLLMDEHLRFEKHITNTVSNCFYRLKVLYQVRESLNMENRIRLCDALVLSKFNYMDVVYGPRLLVRTQQLIQRVQNSCARFCFNIPPRTHVTPYINNFNILKMKARRDLHLACLLFNVIKYRTPPYLADKLLWSRDVNSYMTRSTSYALVLPRPRTVAFRGSFKFAASKCWNDLPPPLRGLKTINAFKNVYKSYLLKVQKS